MIRKVIQESQDQTFVLLIFECLEIVIRMTFRYVQSAIHSHLIPVIDTIIFINKKAANLQPQAFQLVGLLLDQAAGEGKLGRTVVGGKVYEKYFLLSLNIEQQNSI
ncbi:hypothetical protein M3Y94_00426000 [Aphelenchoides besseyi]|nr:hypothetical protein M3Y94_00426000 [Aphelenchoides besseyi]